MKFVRRNHRQLRALLQSHLAELPDDPDQVPLEFIEPDDNIIVYTIYLESFGTLQRLLAKAYLRSHAYFLAHPDQERPSVFSSTHPRRTLSEIEESHRSEALLKDITSFLICKEYEKEDTEFAARNDPDQEPSFNYYDPKFAARAAARTKEEDFERLYLAHQNHRMTQRLPLESFSDFRSRVESSQEDSSKPTVEPKPEPFQTQQAPQSSSNVDGDIEGPRVSDDDDRSFVDETVSGSDPSVAPSNGSSQRYRDLLRNSSRPPIDGFTTSSVPNSDARRLRHNLPNIQDPNSHSRAGRFGMPTKDLELIAGQQLRRRLVLHFDRNGRRIDLNDMSDHITASLHFSLQTLPWNLQVRDEFGLTQLRTIFPIAPPVTSWLPVNAVLSALEEYVPPRDDLTARLKRTFSTSSTKTFAHGFPDLASGIKSIDSFTQRLQVLTYLSRVAKYCASYGFYFPPPDAMQLGNPGSTRYDIYLHDKWISSTTNDGQLRELVASCLVQKLGHISKLSRGLQLCIRDVPRGIYELCVACHHPGLSSIPLSLPRSFPNQLETASLYDYLDFLSMHLYWHYLAGYAFSDRFFIQSMVDHFHPAVRDTLGKRLLDRVRDYDLRPNGYNQPLPTLLFSIDNVFDLLRELQQTLGGSTDYTDPPQSFLRPGARPRPARPVHQLSVDQDSVLSSPSSSSFSPVEASIQGSDPSNLSDSLDFDVEDESSFIHAVLREQDPKLRSCVCCGSTDHLILDCSFFSKMKERFKALPSKALKTKLYYEMIGNSDKGKNVRQIRQYLHQVGIADDSSAASTDYRSTLQPSTAVSPNDAELFLPSQESSAPDTTALDFP